MKMMKVNGIEFTRGETECVVHRLDAVDALVEVLEYRDRGEGDEDWHAPEKTEARCLEMRAQIERGENIVATDELSVDILRDCLEGSTWAVCLDKAPVSDQKVVAVHRVYEAACVKMSRALCVPVQVR